MKEKLKISIFAVTVVYIVVISVMMITAISNQTKTVKYEPILDYEKRLNIIKEEVNKLEENSCIKSIKSLIEFTEQTYYKEEVKIKDLYNNIDSDNWWFSRNIEALSSCELSDEIKKDITPLILASGIQFDELFQKHAYDYELKIFDSVRKSLEPNMQNIENNIRKNLEMEVIKKFIEVYNEK